VQERFDWAVVAERLVVALGGPPVPQPAENEASRPAEDEYRVWLSLHEPTAVELDAMRSTVSTWTDLPLVSVLMPVYDPQRVWLEQAIESVRGQVYPEWELCVADDASQNEGTVRFLQELAASDPRIRVSFRGRNGGIAAASATALSIAKGEIVVLLDHDDVLRPHALFEVVERFRSDSTVDMVYSDEDKILLDGNHGHPAFKPDWSPHSLLSLNYVCHLAAMRTGLVREAGGFRPGFDGSQDHDLFLRASERARRIEHVPKVLYAWKQVPGSASIAADQKPGAHEAGRRAIADALKRRGLRGRVEDGAHAGLYNVRYSVKGSPTVEIIVPISDDGTLLSQCIESIDRCTEFESYSIIMIDSSGDDGPVGRYVRDTAHEVVSWTRPFNLPAMLNAAWRSTDSDYLLFTHSDIIVQDPRWLTVLLEQAQLDEVAFVGCTVTDQDRLPQSCGVTFVGGEPTDVSSVRWPVIRDVSALSGACVMIGRAKLDRLGGFDERYSTGVAVIDVCLRAIQRGRYNVFTPLTSVTHLGGVWDHPDSADVRRLKQTWGAGDGAGRDPFESPHVSTWQPLRLRSERAMLAHAGSRQRSGSRAGESRLHRR
jgi:glycosyltransferase involved in cell wall biosynthesis